MTNDSHADLTAAFLEDIARAVDHWVDTVAQSVASPATSRPWMDDIAPFEQLHGSLGGHTEALREVLADGMVGLAHSVLSILDGATASAEIGRVRLSDDSGREIAESLHEIFMDHLLETGRIS